MTTTTTIAIALCIVFLAIAAWAIVRGGSMGEDDPTKDFIDALERQARERAEARGYVDQDVHLLPGESYTHTWESPKPSAMVNDPDAWKHSAVKRPVEE